MTLEGLEPAINKIINPAVEVATGVMTFEEADQKYVGTKLICPHCFRHWANNIGNDSIVDLMVRRDEQGVVDSGMYTPEVMSNIRQSINTSGLLETLRPGVHAFPESLVVKYRKGMKDIARNLNRFMHWFHIERGNEKRPCGALESSEHAVAVGAMELYLQERYKDNLAIRIAREKDLVVVPGEPPLKRRPDLAVKEADRLLEIYEVQRSPIGKPDFIARTNHLLGLCPTVNWIFFKGAYGTMKPQREWLHSMGLRHYVCWFDNQSKLQVEEGKLPVAKKIQTERTTAISRCRFDEPREDLGWAPEKVPEPTPPLKVVGPAIFRQGPPPPAPVNLRQLPQVLVPVTKKPIPVKELQAQEIDWNCRVNDPVELLVEGKWRRGTVRYFDKSGHPVVRLGLGLGTYVAAASPNGLRPFTIAPDKNNHQGDTFEQISLF